MIVTWDMSVSRLKVGRRTLICVNFLLDSGFIYVGTTLHRLLHLTQYIAPLQADFNPGLNESATVLVYSTGEIYER